MGLLFIFRQCQPYLIGRYIKHEAVLNTAVKEPQSIQKDPIQMAELIMVNPNYYAKVQDILQHISTLVIGNRGTWTVVDSDGVAYILT